MAALAFGAVLWEAAASRIGPAFLPRFTTTMARIYEYALSGVLVDALLSSLALFFTGWSSPS